MNLRLYYYLDLVRFSMVVDTAVWVSLIGWFCCLYVLLWMCAV